MDAEEEASIAAPPAAAIGVAAAGDDEESQNVEHEGSDEEAGDDAGSEDAEEEDEGNGDEIAFPATMVLEDPYVNGDYDPPTPEPDSDFPEDDEPEDVEYDYEDDRNPFDNMSDDEADAFSEYTLGIMYVALLDTDSSSGASFSRDTTWPWKAVIWQSSADRDGQIST